MDVLRGRVRAGKPRPYGGCYWAPTRDAPTRYNYTLRMMGIENLPTYELRITNAEERGG